MADPFLGEIRTVGFNFAPVEWSTCAGQLLSPSQNTALFSLLSTTYGGDGQTTFQLPNTQGRVIVNAAQNVSGLANYPQGQIGGQENVTLSQNQLPTHTHPATFTPSGGGGPVTVSASLTAMSGATATALSATPTPGAQLAQVNPAGPTGAKFYAPAGTAGTPVNLGGLTVSTSGGSITGGTVSNGLAGLGQPTPVLQPYAVLLNIIALQGLYPVRP